MYAQLTEPSPQPARPTVEGRAPCVLVVEDDGDMRRLVAAALRCDGYEIVEAETGLQMLESVTRRSQRNPFDAVVSDIQLPDLTALDVLEGLRCREIATPVVLMTAYGSEEIRSDASMLGAFALFDKPFDWSRLRAAVRTAVTSG